MSLSTPVCLRKLAYTDDRDEAAVAVAIRRGTRRVARRQFRVEAGDELLDLGLHLAHLLTHVQNDFDAGQVDAQIARQVENYFEPFQVARRVKPRVPLATRRL